MGMKLIPITPTRRTLRLAQTGDEAVVIVEKLNEQDPTEAMVEVRGREEAIRVIEALATAFDVSLDRAAYLDRR